MSVGSNLQEMENVVTKGAAKAEPMPKLSTGIAPGQTGSWEDLGGPTPENYTNEPEGPAKLKDPSATLAQVKNVVNKGAKAADPMKKMASPVKEETEEDEEDLISEEEILEATKDEDEDEGSEEDDAEDAKEGKKKKSKKEDDEDVKEDFSIEEDVNALLSGEELSEEFQEKARIIFEAAIKSKVAEIKEELTKKGYGK